MGIYLQKTLVTWPQFLEAFRETGAIYFIRDAAEDAIKVGHSRDPMARLSNLQVGNVRPLTMIGLIAAPSEVEPIVHRHLYEGRLRGEWFHDRGVTSQWLTDMTDGQPMGRHVWKLVPGRQFLAIWDEVTKTHTKHHIDDVTGKWDPPIPDAGYSVASRDVLIGVDSAAQLTRASMGGVTSRALV
jgi:hypothetical protein